MKIVVENVIYSSVKKADISALGDCLRIAYKKAKYNPSSGKSTYVDEVEKLISAKGIFLTGYLPRVKKYLLENNIEYEIENHAERLKATCLPTIKDKTLRDDQERLVKTAIKNQRGILIAPTGCLTGDTMIRINRASKGYEISLRNLYLRHNRISKRFVSSIQTQVRSFNGESIQLQFISDVVYSGKKPTYKMTLQDGTSICATANHKFLTARGWIELKHLLLDDEIMCDTLKATKLNAKKIKYRDNRKFDFNQGKPYPCKIVKIERNGIVDTYDICCPTHHNFIANNMIVHNSGKTLLAGAIISCFPNRKALFLCDKKSLAYQAAQDFKEYGLKNITMVGDGEKDISGNIVIAIQKSLVTLDLQKLSTMFDIVILDECHGLSDKNSQHAEVLRNLLAPIRIGLTATFPTDKRIQLVIEGLLGPIIGELTAAEAKTKNIVADIKVVIRKVEFDQAVRDLRRYTDVYSQGIVNNILFNRMVIREAKYWISQGQIVLIYFNIVDQGKLLKKIANELDVEAVLIHGETKNDDRESTKQLLKSRELKCVIASKIWNTGVNIPPLSVVINAAGGKSDIVIRQLAGRGTRTCEGKDKMIFVDFFNPNSNYFVSHFGHRISQFCDLGWM